MMTTYYNRAGLEALARAGMGDLMPAYAPQLNFPQSAAAYQQQGMSGLGFTLPTDIDWKKWAMLAGAAAVVWFLIKRKSGYAGAVESAKARHREELAKIRKQYKRGGSRVVDAASSAWGSF